MSGRPMFGWDIETDTRVNGLDPRVAAVSSVALWAPGWREVLTGQEPDILDGLADLLGSLEPSLALGWNSSVFDAPFVATRAELYGIDLGWTLVPDASIVPKYDFTPPHTSGYRVLLGKHAHADLAYAFKGYAETAKVPWGLKPVCRSLGVHMVEVDRGRTHELGAAELAEYNLSDARGTYMLGELLGEDLHHWVDEVAGTSSGKVHGRAPEGRRLSDR